MFPFSQYGLAFRRPMMFLLTYQNWIEALYPIDLFICPLDLLDRSCRNYWTSTQTISFGTPFRMLVLTSPLVRAPCDFSWMTSGFGSPGPMRQMRPLCKINFLCIMAKISIVKQFYSKPCKSTILSIPARSSVFTPRMP